MSELDKSNIDALYWAKQFIQHGRDNGWTLDDIDEELMLVWFANYRFAVSDPLEQQLSTLKREVLKEAAFLAREAWGFEEPHQSKIVRCGKRLQEALEVGDE